MGGLITAAGGAALAVDQKSSDDSAARKNLDDTYAQLGYDARLAEMKGATGAGAARMAGSSLAAQQNTAYANSGVDQSVGTAASVQAGTETLSELDAQVVRNNAAREAWGYQVQKDRALSDYEVEKKNNQRKLEGSILTSFGQAASSIGSMK